MVRRIYVEKKKGFDVEAEPLFNDVKENLHLDGLQGVRILNRYDMDGIDDATYEAAKFTVFAEPAIDIVYEETMPEDDRFCNFFRSRISAGTVRSEGRFGGTVHKADEFGGGRHRKICQDDSAGRQTSLSCRLRQ